MTTTSPPLPHADFERWITECWRTERRYYQADILQDLFGTWLLKRSWGGLGSRRRSSMTHVVTAYEEALQLLDEVAKKRLKRGYVSIT